ncbi:hypothetical protein HN011_007794 [Eciton burchellii]|nr:hypothetical protein HN011_007794 [Eciton burchellii]
MMWRQQDRIKSKNDIIIPQAWARTSKNSQKLPRFWSLKIIFTYLKLYCEYSSLDALKYLVKRNWLERIVWIIIYCITIFNLVFILYISYQEYIMTPTVTSVETDSYPTTNLDFPGIAICSINRISKQSAVELATKIFNANITNQRMTEILILISQLGNHYSSDFRMDMRLNVELDHLLKTYYNGDYDITEIMKNLSPQCSTILMICKLRGKMRNCSELFEFRKTENGFCCTFNYMRESDDIPVLKDIHFKTKSVYKVSDLGIEYGLTVVLKSFLDDYFFPILPSIGWKVIVFNPQDYPDVSSGGVTEILVFPASETYIDINPISFSSMPIIKNVSPKKRNCVFSTEVPMHDGTSYTYSDCIVSCKLHDMQHICGCRPFFYPRRGKHEYSQRICTNLDLGCLAKYKSKWWSVFPHETEHEIIQNETWALHCHFCYPVCDDINYDILTTKSYLKAGNYQTNLLWNINITDEAIVHMFSSKYGSTKLKQDVSSYWYELLSNIGGICGIFIGFSLISIVEFLYFIALMLRDLFHKKLTLEDDDSSEDKIQSIPCESIQTIYWSELMPRSWQSTKYGQFPQNRTKD